MRTLGISVLAAVFVAQMGMAVPGLAVAAAHHSRRSALDLDYIAMMDGRCERLVLAQGPDASSRCEPHLMNEVFKSGRVGFTFMVGDLAVVSFSGTGQQVKDDPNTASQPVDRVTFTLIGTGTPPNVIPAAGVCTYTNPYAGPSHVTCSAHTSNGNFEGAFVSDGHDPKIKHFR